MATRARPRGFAARLRTNAFFRRVAMLSASVALGQLIIYATSPLISRLYSPADFGVVASYFATLTAVSFLGTFNYELAVPIERNALDAVSLVRAALTLLVASTVLLLVVVIVIPRSAIDKVASGDLGGLVYLLPLGFFLVGAYQVFVQWAYRLQDFRNISKTRIVQPAGQAVINIALGVASVGAIGLLAGRVTGQSAGTLSLAKPMLGFVRASKERRVPIRPMLRRYRHFCIYTTPRRYLGDMVNALPLLFLGRVHSADAVGLYSFAMTTIQSPLNVLGDSISSVYIAQSARDRYTDRKLMRRRGDQIAVALVGISVVIVGALLLVGPEVFSVVFGSRWREAGTYSAFVAIAACARFAFKPSSSIFDVLERQGVALWLTALRICLVVAALWVSSACGVGPVGMIFWYSLSVVMGYAVQFVVSRRLTPRDHEPSTPPEPVL